jgi:hypothetical protein
LDAVLPLHGMPVASRMAGNSSVALQEEIRSRVLVFIKRFGPYQPLTFTHTLFKGTTKECRKCPFEDCYLMSKMVYKLCMHSKFCSESGS